MPRQSQPVRGGLVYRVASRRLRAYWGSTERHGGGPRHPPGTVPGSCSPRARPRDPLKPGGANEGGAPSTVRSNVS